MENSGTAAMLRIGLSLVDWLGGLNLRGFISAASGSKRVTPLAKTIVSSLRDPEDTIPSSLCLDGDNFFRKTSASFLL